MAHPSGTANPDELDAARTLAAADEALHARRAAEVAEMHLAAHWAALHGHPHQHPTGKRDPMTHRRAVRAPPPCASTRSPSSPWSARPTPPPPAP